MSETSYSQNLTCIACKTGKMRPDLSEGDADFTDQYICDNCQHQDTIPTYGIIASQTITSLIGGTICSYLLATSLAEVLAFYQRGTSESLLQHIILVVLASIFLGGFVFICFKAYQGFKHRKTYQKHSETKPEP